MILLEQHRSALGALDGLFTVFISPYTRTDPPQQIRTDVPYEVSASSEAEALTVAKNQYTIAWLEQNLVPGWRVTKVDYRVGSLTATIDLVPLPAVPTQSQTFLIRLHYFPVFSSGELFFGGNEMNVTAQSVGEAYLLARDGALTQYPPARYGYHQLGIHTDDRETWVAWQSSSVPGGLIFFPLPSGSEYALPSGASDIPSASVAQAAAQTHAELFPDLYRVPTVTGTDKEAIEIINSGTTEISFFSLHNDADYQFRALKFKAPSNPLVIYDEAGIQAAATAWPDTMYLVNSRTFEILEDHGTVASAQEMTALAFQKVQADSVKHSGQVAEKDLLYMKALVLDRFTHPSVWLYVGQLVVKGTPGAYLTPSAPFTQQRSLVAGGDVDNPVVWKDPFDPQALDLFLLRTRYHPTSILNGLHIYAHIGTLLEIQRRYKEKAQQEAGAWTTRRILEFAGPAVAVVAVTLAAGPAGATVGTTLFGTTVAGVSLAQLIIAVAVIGFSYLPSDPNDLKIAIRVGAVVALAFLVIKELWPLLEEVLRSEAERAAKQAAEDAAKRALSPASPPISVPPPVSVPTLPGATQPPPVQATLAPGISGPVLVIGLTIGLIVIASVLSRR